MLSMEKVMMATGQRDFSPSTMCKQILTAVQAFPYNPQELPKITLHNSLHYIA